MAFLKHANAKIAKTNVQSDDWSAVQRDNGIRVALEDKGAVFKEYSPDKYLLTHCTIIASVDVQKDGPVNKEGWHYVITPESEKYVNSNQDAWTREVLLQTFETFRGAENYVEHIQIPELSKGKIIDAVARDLGDTVYVDILVATDRKHKDLVAAIESGEMTTLSMGCSVEATTCTRCGNIAQDDTETCAHIRYQKGNHWFDSKGKRRIIAELCGHETMEDPDGGVVFIEASWVGNPAFKGAVMRNILNLQEASDKQSQAIAAQIVEAFDVDRSVDPSVRTRAASTDISVLKQALSTMTDFVRKAEFDFDDKGDEGEEGGGETEEEKPPIDELADDVKEYIRNRVRKDLRDEISGIDRNKSDTRTEDGNESLVRSHYGFSAFRNKYASYGSDLALYRLYEGLISLKTGGWSALSAKGYTGREILALSHFIDSHRGQSTLTKQAYEAIVKVGGASPYDDPMDYLKAWAKVAGVNRMPIDFARALIIKGKIYSYGS